MGIPFATVAEAIAHLTREGFVFDPRRDRWAKVSDDGKWNVYATATESESGAWLTAWSTRRSAPKGQTSRAPKPPAPPKPAKVAPVPRATTPRPPGLRATRREIPHGGRTPSYVFAVYLPDGSTATRRSFHPYTWAVVALNRHTHRYAVVRMSERRDLAEAEAQATRHAAAWAVRIED